jgi:hypothetical protein
MQLTIKLNSTVLANKQFPLGFTIITVGGLYMNF